MENRKERHSQYCLRACSFTVLICAALRLCFFCLVLQNAWAVDLSLKPHSSITLVRLSCTHFRLNELAPQCPIHQAVLFPSLACYLGLRKCSLHLCLLWCGWRALPLLLQLTAPSRATRGQPCLQN